MTRALRTLHRRLFYVAAVITPAIFVVGVAKRDPQLPVDSLRPTLKTGFVEWRSGLLATRRDSRSVTVEVLRPLHVPDPLLFCTTSTKDASRLPDDAVLLGEVHDGAVLGSCNKPQLVLYSLGHRAVIDQLALEAQP